MKVTGKTVLWEGKFLGAVRIQYSDVEVQRYWEAVERVGCDGIVAIVAFTDAQEVILIRQLESCTVG
jgi:hypothetical protein